MEFLLSYNTNIFHFKWISFHFKIALCFKAQQSNNRVERQ